MQHEGAESRAGGEPTTGQRVRSITLPYVGLRSLGQAAEFVGWIVLARRLDPSGLGEVAVGFLLCRYAGLVADWGAIGRGARDVAAAGRHGSVRGYLQLRTSIAAALSVVGSALFVLTGHAVMVPLIVVLMSVGMNRDWISLGMERGFRAGLPAAVQGVVLMGASVTADTPGMGAAVVGVGYGVGLAASLMLNPAPDDKATARPGRQDHWLLVALIANQVTSSLDILLLNWMASTTDAGIYATVYRFPNAFVALLGGVIGALVPIATRTHHEDEGEHGRLVSRSLRVSALSASAVLASAPVLYYLIPVVLGDAYAPGRVPMVLLVVATAVITLMAPLHSVLVARGRDRRYALLVSAGTGLNVGLNLVLIPRFGMVGAGTSTLIAQVLVAALVWSAAMRQGGRRRQRRPDE